MKLLALLCVGVVATPCLWDSDTLDDELRGLPDAFDLVVGRWHRHSDAYYQQRVERLAGRATLSLDEYDDLAVAFEHLDRRGEAIDVMRRKGDALAAQPDRDHQYRYHANLGTFLAHAGDFDAALVELRQAIAINPDAHFGREQFQIDVIEYVAAARKDPGLWSRRSALTHAGYAMSQPIYSLLLHGDAPDEEDVGRPEPSHDLDFEAAYRGIGGMLRFGGREGAELYRDLAELFAGEGHLNLAWWALQRAIERGHPAAERLREMTANVERHWRKADAWNTDSRHGIPTPADFRRHRDAADRWLQVFQTREAAAIARGEDVNADATLRALLAATDEEVPRPTVPWSFSRADWRIGALGVAAIGLLVLVVDRHRRQRSAAAAA